MRIVKLKIKDFILFEEVDLELDGSVYLITGMNKDQLSQGSNGSGKSAFTQAISWCLFEDLRDGFLKDDVIRYDAEYCQVEVTVEAGDKTIVVDRVRNHPDRGNDVDLYVNGEEVSLHKVVDTNAQIERHLGVSSKMFFHCSYSDEAEVKPPFASLTPARMMQAVSEIVNIDRFDSYRKETNKLLSDFKEKKAAAEATFLAAAKSVEYIETQLDKARVAWENFEVETEARRKVITEKIHDCETEELELREASDLLHPDVLKYRDYNLGFLDDIADIEGDIKTYESDIVDARRRVSEIDVDKSRLAERLAGLEQEYKNLAENEEGVCNYCGNQLENSDTLMEKTTAIQKRMAEEGDEILKLEASKVKAESEVKRLTAAKAEAEAKLEELEGQRKEYEELQSVYEDYQRIDTARTKNADRILELKNQRKQLGEGQKMELEKRLKDLRSDLSDAKRKEDEADEELGNYECEEQAAELLKKTLSTVKAGVLNAFIIDLVDAINANLYRISEGDFEADLDLKQDSLILTFSNARQHRKYATFSRGERVRIAKAVQLALIQITGTGVLIDDEGLSGVDPAGVSKLLDVVLNSGLETLFFTSHDPAVNDYFRKKNVQKIVVQKKNEIATVDIRSMYA